MKRRPTRHASSRENVPNDDNGWGSFARYFSLAIMLPASTVAGYGLGYWLDHAFGTHYLAMVCLVLGAVGGFIQLIQGLKKG
jgi:F0F1-type ATP synthase assembly protein I